MLSTTLYSAICCFYFGVSILYYLFSLCRRTQSHSTLSPTRHIRNTKRIVIRFRRKVFVEFSYMFHFIVWRWQERERERKGRRGGEEKNERNCYGNLLSMFFVFFTILNYCFSWNIFVGLRVHRVHKFIEFGLAQNDSRCSVSTYLNSVWLGTISIVNYFDRFSFCFCSIRVVRHPLVAHASTLNSNDVQINAFAWFKP